MTQKKTMSNIRNTTIWLLTLIILTAQAHAFSADLTLDIQASGIINMEGATDYPPLDVTSTESFTFKKGPYWLLNITSEEQFENFEVTTIFPKRTEINYIKVSGDFRVVEEDRLQIISTGENKPLQIVVQYRIVPVSEAIVENPITAPLIFIILFVAICTLGILQYIRKRKPKKSSMQAIKETLTDNQQK